MKVNEPTSVVLSPAASMSDWYLIERADHDGRSWFETVRDDEIGTYTRFMTSERICDADVEGTLDEMKGIAAAIRARSSFSAKRCAVVCDKETGTAEFWSPRNSRTRGSCTLEQADRLAAQIEALS